MDPTARSVFFADSLRDLIANGAFKGRRAICAIPAYQTLIQHFHITRVERQELDEQINTHLKQRLNIDPTRMVIRHFEVGEVVRDGTTRQEVICLAASREAVMRHIETARKAKLDVVGMQSEPLAIIQSLAHLYRRAGDELRVTCFIDLGAATSKVVIAHGTRMVFAKMIHAAGDHFTRQVAEARSIGFDEARKARIEASCGVDGRPALAAPLADSSETPVDSIYAVESVNGTTRTVVATAPPPTSYKQPAPASVVDKPLTPSPSGLNPNDPSNFRETLDCLLDELHLCVRYHHNMFPQSPIEKLIFVGGEARHVKVCQEIARSLRIGAQLGDPLARAAKATQGASALGVDLNQPQPGWAVPMGLCLSETVL
jgi:Tfp pilus assembly PilM family ATPase